MKKNCKLIATLLCVTALLVAGVVIWSMAGQGGPNPTEPTGNNGAVDTGAATEGTGNSGDTKPSEDTKPSDGTEATDGTDPSGEVTDPSEEATQPSEDVTQPSEDATEPSGDATEPEPTEPAPTEPAPTEPAPTEPAPTNPPATEPPAPTAPTEDANDFGGYTPATITAEVYKSWSYAKWRAFRDTYPESEMTPEERHNFLKATKYGGYTCTEHDDHCINEAAHNRLLENLAKPCRYCGQTNCPSYMHINPDTLYFEEVQCESYDIHNDPNWYCQICGKPTYGDDKTQLCSQYLGDTYCTYCGVWVEGWTCHTCKQEDIDNHNGG